MTEKKAKKSAKKKKPPSARTLKSFYKAMKESKLDKVEAELTRGIDASIEFDIQGSGEPWSALYYATYHDKTDIAMLLLDAGADASATFEQGGPLHVVRDAALAKRLVDGGADVNCAPKSYAPLHRVRDADIAQILVDGGADVYAETDKGLTPFECTMDLGVRRVLLAAGAKGLRETEGEPHAMNEEEVALGEFNVMGGKVGVGAEGFLWIGSHAGLVRSDGDKATRFAGDGYPATSAIAAAHGSTYIATNQGLLRFCDGSFTRYTPNNSPLHDQHIVGMAVLNDEVWCVGYERESKTKHVSVFNGKVWRLLEPGKELPECDIEHMMVDAKGGLVVSDREQGGMHVQALGSSEWTHENLAEGIFAPKIYAMATRGGVDYFGTHMGLFRRVDGGFEKMRDGAFGQLGWIGATLWAATNWDGVFAFDGDDVEEYGEERAGHSLSNVESMVVHGDDLYLLAGQKFLRLRRGEFKEVG